jgi:hypothetical protein
MADVEKWLGVEVTCIKSKDYGTIDDVFEKTRYMAGVAGARCTVEMKKRPRYDFQRADDIHVFGLTAEETDRIDRLVGNNPELSYDWILRDRGVTKRETLYRIEKAGIELPAMYRLGFKNNNCIGCVKATSISYWRRIRECFPEVFARRAKQSRDLDVRLVRLDGVRIFLDEIPHDELSFAAITENVSCGPECAEG